MPDLTENCIHNYTCCVYVSYSIIEGTVMEHAAPYLALRRDLVLSTSGLGTSGLGASRAGAGRSPPPSDQCGDTRYEYQPSPDGPPHSATRRSRLGRGPFARLGRGARR